MGQQYSTHAFERMIASQENFEASLPAKVSQVELVRIPYKLRPHPALCLRK
jgi:hypothetical protein